MAHSFDIVSKVNMDEVKNGINMAMKEIKTRFDLKGSSAGIQLEENHISLIADDDFKLKAVREILEQKLVKRKVPLKALNYNSVEAAFSGNVKQRAAIQEGIPTEKAREIVKAVKRSGTKVQVAIQEDQLRVSGKSKDALQQTISLIKDKFKDINLQFTNYR